MFKKWRQFVNVLAILFFFIMVLGAYNYCLSQSEIPHIRKRTIRSLIAEFEALASEMTENGYDISNLLELQKKSKYARKKGNRQKARGLLHEAILELKNIKSKDMQKTSKDRSKELKSNQYSVYSAQKPHSLKSKTTVSIPISTEKVRVIDTFPLETDTISNNTLQNFRYYELNTVKGVLELNINFPVIVQEYPYTDFKFKNNKAFGATESSEGILGLSPGKINSRLDTILNIISKSGVGLARDFKAYDTRRPSIERQKGTYNFSRSDYAVNAAINNGIYFIGRLTPHHVRKKGGPPEDESAYVDYIKKTVNRYKGRVKYWQTLKEPEPRVRRRVAGNDGGLSPEQAVRIFMLSYNTIKSVDENAIVYFPGPGPGFQFGSYNADTYFEKIISLGGAKYFDVLGFGAYKHDVEKRYEKFRNILKKYGYEKPLWVAQTGAPDSNVGTFPWGGSPEAQCEFMVKVYARSFAIGIEKVFWGEFVDESLKETKEHDDKSRMWNATGLFYTGTWRLKPGYFTHRLLASSLHSFTKAEKVAPNIVKFTFANKSPVYIIWPH